MSLPILTIIGATGTQGGSVVSAILKDASPKYHIRALTSNVSSATATRLAQDPNITVVHVDVNSVDSLKAAFEGSHSIFANTIFPPGEFGEKGPAAAQALEERQGLNIVEAAARTPTLKHLVWSTLPDTYKISKAATSVPHFQAKLPAEKFARDPSNGLADKTTFLRVGMYGNNLTRPPYRPIFVERANKFLLLSSCRADTPMPFIGDEDVNIGVFVRAIFAQPDKSLGRFVLGSAETLTCTDWAEAFTEARRRNGKQPDVDTAFVGCDLVDFGNLWGAGGIEIGLMMQYYQNYGMDGWNLDTGDKPILTAEDLGIQAELKSTVDRLARINTNWLSAYDETDNSTLV